MWAFFLLIFDCLICVVVAGTAVVRCDVKSVYVWFVKAVIGEHLCSVKVCIRLLPKVCYVGKCGEYVLRVLSLLAGRIARLPNVQAAHEELAFHIWDWEQAAVRCFVKCCRENNVGFAWSLSVCFRLPSHRARRARGRRNKDWGLICIPQSWLCLVTLLGYFF